MTKLAKEMGELGQRVARSDTRRQAQSVER